jgi:hypothetical protein
MANSSAGGVQGATAVEAVRVALPLRSSMRQQQNKPDFFTSSGNVE